MLDISSKIILIKGEPRSLNIESITPANEQKMAVMFKENPKTYLYKKENVVIIEESLHIDGEYAVVMLDGTIRQGISDLWCFTHHGMKYWRIKYKIDKVEEYPGSRIQVEVSCLANEKARNVWTYLKQVAEINPLKNDINNQKILLTAYEKIKQIPNSTAADVYLNTKHHSKKLRADFFIYPFGCNSSQKKAVENALRNQVSIIQGPPGTGKTQTILNIIANLLIQGKTILVVSNNNSATANVKEKLAKYGIDFIVATLGSHDNKETFIKEGQPPIPENVKDWGIEEEEKTVVEKEIQRISLQLDKVFDLKNQQATSRLELENLKLEWTHFKSNHNISDGTFYLKRSLSSIRLTKMWVKLQEFADTRDDNSKSFWQWLKWLWTSLLIRYWLHLKSKFDKHHLDELIIELQALYYMKRIEELEQELRQIEDELQLHDNKTLMDSLSDHSMMILKNTLHARYSGRMRREFTDADTLSTQAEEVLKEYPVITSTTFSARSSLGGNTIYDYVIMDESSQVSLETGTLALTCAKNAVIVGDTKQLPNVITNNDREKLKVIFGLSHIDNGYDSANHSFLESVSIMIKDVPQTLLREHYRCNSRIINFCNQKFYGGNLLIMKEDETNKNVLAAYKTVKGNHAANMTNLREIEVIKQEVIPELKDICLDEIGIITPYNNQVNAIRQQLPDIEVGTVHKFQGREKDVIIMSVVSNQINDFIDDPHLINVAVSRAKKKFYLVVTGNEQEKTSNIKDLIDYIDYNNCKVVDSKVFSIFDYLYSQYTDMRIAFLESHPKISEYASENIAYSLIKSILESDRKYSCLHVLCHIPLRSIFRQTDLMSEEERIYAGNFNTHVDFLIINRATKQPLLGIEIDGYAYHHKGTVQSSRDALKDHIFKSYHLQLLRLSTKGANEEEKVKERLDTIC